MQTKAASINTTLGYLKDLLGSFPVFRKTSNHNLRLEKYFPDFMNATLGWKKKKMARS